MCQVDCNLEVLSVEYDCTFFIPDNLLRDLRASRYAKPRVKVLNGFKMEIKFFMPLDLDLLCVKHAEPESVIALARRSVLLGCLIVVVRYCSLQNHWDDAPFIIREFYLLEDHVKRLGLLLERHGFFQRL